MRRKRKKRLKKIKKRVFLFLIIVIGLLTSIFIFRSISLYLRNKKISKAVITKKKSFIRKPQPLSSSSNLRIPILMYHYVEIVTDQRDTIRKSLNITPNVFEQQIKTLLNDDYTFITASDLGNIFEGKLTIPKKPILITFDDGHWDLYTDILPILKKYNIKATTYVISEFVDRLDFLTSQQLQEIIDSNLIEIGAHTQYHSSLQNMSEQYLIKEIVNSKQTLETRFHIKVVSFAYPNGQYDNQTINIIKRSSYLTSASSYQGVYQNQNNRYHLSRLRPGYRVGDELLRYLDQFPTPTIKK